MAEDSWSAHAHYLEDEVKKLVERARKLEEMIPNLDCDQKRVGLRELANHLRAEASEHSKYLALVKHK